MFHLLSLAALFLLLQAQFVAAAQVVVYAGAVMVLYVFVVAYVGAAEAAHFKAPVGGAPARVRDRLRARAVRRARDRGARLRPRRARHRRPDACAFGFGGPEQIGQALLTKFLVAFEVASFLLLIAAVGAVVLARRRGGIHEEETRVSAMAFLRPPGVGTMAEARRGPHRHAGAPRARPARRRPARRERTRRDCASLLDRGHRRPPAGALAMSIDWFLVVSALVFCIGAGGVLTRRNPLVVLLCLELMLNAANIALIAFARMWGNIDGQIFAIIVMVVAACEVCIGLGLVVAIYRRRLPIDVDELRELQG